MIEAPPDCIQELCRDVERQYGLQVGHLNNMMLTYYYHGSDQFLVNHQDKAVDYRCQGAVEDQNDIFNFSFGEPRAFVLTDLNSLHKSDRKDMLIYGDYTMEHGDLFRIEPHVNRDYAQGVPRDDVTTGLRVMGGCHGPWGQGMSVDAKGNPAFGGVAQGPWPPAREEENALSRGSAGE